MQRVCVYCGSSTGRKPDYVAAAAELGRQLAERGIGLVYGGAGIGVMGAVANAVLAAGGEVVGVIPHSLATREVAHPGLSELHVVDTMHQRKTLMAELSGGFIALPGGWGTFEELFEILTWAQLGMHRKPCGLLNIAGYFDHLQHFLQHAVDEQFVRAEFQPILTVETNPASLLDAFARYQAPQMKKWIGPDET